MIDYWVGAGLRDYWFYTNLMGRCTYLDPPRIPLKKGDFEKNLVPPLLRGARQGGLIVERLNQGYEGY